MFQPEFAIQEWIMIVKVCFQKVEPLFEPNDSQNPYGTLYLPCPHTTRVPPSMHVDIICGCLL